MAARRGCRRSVHPPRGTAALLFSGAHSGEVGHITVADLDIVNAEVWLHGTSRYTPRHVSVAVKHLAPGPPAHVARTSGSSCACGIRRFSVPRARPAPASSVRIRHIRAARRAMRGFGLKAEMPDETLHDEDGWTSTFGGSTSRPCRSTASAMRGFVNEPREACDGLDKRDRTPRPGLV